MRITFVLLPLALLAACSTPQERCISNSGRELRVLTNLASETRRNISRGYALERQQEVRITESNCEGTNSDGSSFFFQCSQSETITTQVPVAIDIDSEQSKLVSLEERIVSQRAAAQTAMAQCRAAYPE